MVESSHFSIVVLLFAAAVAAVARDLDDILIHRIPAMVAAKFCVADDGAATGRVCTLIIFCHK